MFSSRKHAEQLLGYFTRLHSEHGHEESALGIECAREWAILAEMESPPVDRIADLLARVASRRDGGSGWIALQLGWNARHRPSAHVVRMRIQMRAVSFLIVSILLAFIEPACAEELNTNDLRIFAIDFAWNRKGPPAEWLPVGLVVHESGANKRPSGPFTTAAAFRKWIPSMPRSSILRYDAG